MHKSGHNLLDFNHTVELMPTVLSCGNVDLFQFFSMCFLIILLLLSGRDTTVMQAIAGHRLIITSLITLF